jgi:hypothetical protein
MIVLKNIKKTIINREEKVFLLKILIVDFYYEAFFDDYFLLFEKEKQIVFTSCCLKVTSQTILIMFSVSMDKIKYFRGKERELSNFDVDLFLNVRNYANSL